MDWKIDLPETPAGETQVQCSFCNSSQVPPDRALGGPDVFICHDCVRFANSQTAQPDEPSSEAGNLRTCSFCQEEREFLDLVATGDKDVYICTECLTGFAAVVEGEAG